MHTKTKKKPAARKHLVAVLMAALFLVLAEFVLTAGLEPLTEQMKDTYYLSQMAKKGQYPNMVILGDSTMGGGMDPAVLDDEIGDVSLAVNAATGRQPLAGSYYYLEDLLERYPDIHRVIIGLTYDQLIHDDTNLMSELLVFDHIKDPEIKLQYGRTFLDINQLPYLAKSYRYRNELDSFTDNIRDKIDFYQNPGETRSIGYMPAETRQDPDKGEIGMGDVRFEEKDIDQTSLHYLKAIFSLCKEKNVQVCLVTTLIGDAEFYSSDDVKRSHEYLANLAESCGVPFYDLNLWIEREERDVGHRMADTVHVTKDLAEEQTAVIGKILNGEDPDDFFYPDVETARADIHGVLLNTVNTTPNEDGSRTVHAGCILTDNMTPQYQIAVQPDGDEEVDLTNGYTSSSETVLPAQYVGSPLSLIVRVKAEGQDGTEYQRTLTVHIDAGTWG